MSNALQIVQIVISLLIVALVLLQAQGTGLGAAWGGGGETYHTKRGVEKVIFYLTIAAIIVFTILALTALMT